MENNQIKWKYIVYETTNLINNKIYIGVHKTINPDVWDYYLGCGVIATQPYTYQHAKTAFQHAVKKYGPKAFVRKTLAVFDTDIEAFALEEELVNEKFLERSDVYNMILGGQRGLFNTLEIKVYNYDLNGNYVSEFRSMAEAGAKFNVDYSAISYAVRKKRKSCGYYWNTDKVKKLDLTNYQPEDTYKFLLYLYNFDGIFYKESNVDEVLDLLNVTFSELKESIILGTCINKFYISFIKANNFSIAKSEYSKTRKVYKYDGTTGDFVKEYNSQWEAELIEGVNVAKSIRLRASDANGFLWALEKTNKYNYKRLGYKRRVGKYDLNNNLVKIYDSATAAERENGTSVWKVLNNSAKTHKQHVYRYLS